MFQVFVDSAANIPAERVEQTGIHVIPFINIVDGKEIPGFTPGLTPEEERARGREYYDAIRNGAEVKTSLINTDKFMEEFRPVLAAGEDVLYISLSRNISGTYNAARLAAEGLADDFTEAKVYLVDSLNASLAQGILALYAVEMREEGKSAEETAKELSERAHRMNGVFTVDNLKYLARTGRLSNASALFGNLLKIKPLLKGNAEGFIVCFKKCAGRRMALKNLVDIVCDNIVEPAKQIIGIAYADAYEDAKWVMEEILKRISVREFLDTSYDFCTGSHVGPDTIALFFMGKDRELEGNA